MVVGIRQTSKETSTATLGTVPGARLRHAEHRVRLQRHHRQQEDQRQARDQNIERDFVGRLLALGAFHQRDHAIQERFAGVGRDANLDVIRQHAVCRR